MAWKAFQLLVDRRRPNPYPEHPLPGQTNKLSLFFPGFSLGPQKPHLVWGPLSWDSGCAAYRYNCCLKVLWSELSKCKCSYQLQVEHFCELFSHYEQIKFIVRPLAESKESWQRGGFSISQPLWVGGVRNQPDILAGARENSLQHIQTHRALFWGPWEPDLNWKGQKGEMAERSVNGGKVF